MEPINPYDECDGCDATGTPDEWPFVKWRNLGGHGAMLCDDCWRDIQSSGIEDISLSELARRMRGEK